MNEQRDRVAESLLALTQVGGVLDVAAFRLPGITPDGGASFDRAKTRHEIAETYLAGEPSDLQFDGAAVITAGPPGAGKSVHIAAAYPANQWRTIDADTVKDMILDIEIPVGTFTRQLAATLADGCPVMPRELAGLIHHESVIIADLLRRRCLENGENIIMEGTLGWAPHGPRLVRELAAAGYSRVDIVDVDVPAQIALEQAANRWWQGRLAAIAGRDPLGGRFTPPAAVTSKYTKSGRSICSINARATFDTAAVADFDEVNLMIHGRHEMERFTHTAKKSSENNPLARGPGTTGE